MQAPVCSSRQQLVEVRQSFCQLDQLESHLNCTGSELVDVDRMSEPRNSHSVLERKAQSSRSQSALPCCTSPLTRAPHTQKELVPHVTRLALSSSSVNTAGSGKIKTHPKFILLWGNGRSRAQRINHARVIVVTTPRGSSTLGNGRGRARSFMNAGVTVTAAPKVQSMLR